MNEQYFLQQVCLNGHQITASYKDHMTQMPFSTIGAAVFCEKCGEKTITHCQHCKNGIIGMHNSLIGAKAGAVVPSYCKICGKPYPWTENKIQTAIQMFAEFGNLDEEEKKTIEQDINNIARDVPQSELSALRIKKIWQKYGVVAYNVIMEFASKTAAEILKKP